MQNNSIERVNRISELKAKSHSQNVISANEVSYSRIKNTNIGDYIDYQHKKEGIFFLVNEAGFVPQRKTVHRNIPFDLNCKLAELLVLPRYRKTFVMGYFDSINHINSITFKQVASSIMKAIEQTERRLKVKILTPTDISYEMFENVRSTSLKNYMHQFVAYSHSSVKGDSC